MHLVIINFILDCKNFSSHSLVNFLGNNVNLAKLDLSFTEYVIHIYIRKILIQYYQK